MIRTLILLGIGLGSVVAYADEAKAKQLFEQGERSYNLGEWDKAVELFRKAYEESPEPAFLFNIAQTYRQSGNCRQAQFFYKRFLALKANDTKKPIKPELQAEVEKRITELEECIKREIANKPPDQLASPTPPNKSPTNPQPKNTQPTDKNDKNDKNKPPTNTAQVDPNNTEDDQQEETPEKPPEPTALPKLISVRAALGAGKLTAGSLGTTFQFAATLTGGYPLSFGNRLELDLGAAIAFTPVPYTTTMNAPGTAGVLGLLVDVAPSYTIIPKLAARLDVGLGLLVLTGLELDGNPFTMGGAPATGALSTFMARFAVSADYAITPNIFITVAPFAFSYSPVPPNFEPSITSLTTMAFMAGAGYRQ